MTKKSAVVVRHPSSLRMLVAYDFATRLVLVLKMTARNLLTLVLCLSAAGLGCNTSEAYRRGYSIFWEPDSRDGNSATFSIHFRGDVFGRGIESEQLDQVLKREFLASGKCPNGYKLIGRQDYQGTSSFSIMGECLP